jgi:glycosidase
MLGMPDLAIYKEHTRNMILGYLNRLIDIGAAGFRVDAVSF